MSITSKVGINAYETALANFQKIEKINTQDIESPLSSPQAPSFGATLKDSLTKVNEMQAEKSGMITAFASGETQNVHELMITMQKAGLAMNITSAVRSKVMDAYRELSRIQF